MSTTLPSSRSDDSSTAADWRARFLATHPSGEAEAFEAWASDQPGLVEDDALRERVRVALDEWRRSKGLLEFGADQHSGSTFFGRRGGERQDQPAEGDTAAVQPGQRIGRFVCKSFLARGGMGQVWIAEDTDLRRDVALKLVLPERVDTKALELFAREARAGGRLNHPNLVTTLAYGTDEGLSWIAQELVEGSWTLKDSLDDLRRLDTVPDGYYRHVPELVAKLADALQAAHDAGIIHRDVKPANVLITEDDEPKLTDFGLARITDESVMSISGDVMGTWAYMSPEQVRAVRSAVDHRTDVFSLGIVLYELLAMRRPFEGDTTQQLAHRIQNTDPIAPSKLRSQCPTELSVICAKALEKAPGERYASAAELADDLRRHLANEPILARPPGTLARALKWVRRNPTISAAGAVGIAALAVVSTLLVENVRTNADLELSNAELETSNAALSEQTALAEARAIEIEAERVKTADALLEEQQRSEELATVAEFQSSQLGSVDPESMGLYLRQGLREKLRDRGEPRGLTSEETEAMLVEYDQLMAGADFTGLGVETLQAQIFEPALKAIESEFDDQPTVAASLLQAVASASQEMGLLDFADGPQREALEARRRVLGDQHPSTLVSVNKMGQLLRVQGKLSEAEPYCLEAMELRRRVLGDEHPNTHISILNLGKLLNAQGKLSEAEPYYREALEAIRRVLGDEHPNTLSSIHDMGSLLQDQGKLSEAEPYYREALETSRRMLGDEHPGMLASINNLGTLLAAQGKLSEAEPYHREALETSRRMLGDEHPNTLSSISNMGSLMYAQGKLSEAEPYYREVLMTSRRVLGDEHPDTLISINNMGVLLYVQGRLFEAEPYYREGLETNRRVLGDEHPNTLLSINNMGGLLQAQGNLSEAELYLREALETSRRMLGDEHPNTLSSINSMGRLLKSQGKLSEAEPYYREGLEASRRVLGDEHPSTLTYIGNLGLLLQAQGKLSEAEPYFHEALEANRRSLGKEHPDTLTSINNMGLLLYAQGKLSEVEPYFLEALETRRRVLGDEHSDTLTSIGNLGVLLQAQGKPSEAEPYVREALESRRRLMGDEHPETLLQISNMDFLLQTQGKLSEAERYCREVLEARLRVLGSEHPDTLTSIGRMGSLLEAQGKLSEAEPYLREALEVSRRVLGDEHLDTSQQLRAHFEVLLDLERPDHARALLEDFLATSSLPEDHEVRVEVRGMLANPEAAAALEEE